MDEYNPRYCPFITREADRFSYIQYHNEIPSITEYQGNKEKSPFRPYPRWNFDISGYEGGRILKNQVNEFQGSRCNKNIIDAVFTSPFSPYC